VVLLVEVVLVVEVVAMLALHEEALEKGICDVLKKEELDNKKSPKMQQVVICVHDSCRNSRNPANTGKNPR
jgi:hypothetical protein